MIGPLHGVHPAPKAVPIKIEPKNPDGLFLNCIFLSFIRKLKFSTPVIIRPKIMIRMEPSCLIRSAYSINSPPKNNVPKPSAIYTRLRSEEHTSELQSRGHLVCRLLLEKKK